MLQQKCGEFRIDYPYLQKDNLLNSSRDLLVAFGSLRKKRMKRGRKAERGIQRERGKNEKVIKRKGDREKGTRRKRQGKKREKEKER